MKLLMDTNVLLDVALQRERFLIHSDTVVRWCRAHRGSGFVAWHSISNLYYVIRNQLGDRQAREFVAAMLGIFEVAATGTAMAKHALQLPLPDLEDSLQVVAALAAAADAIVTRDKSDYRGAPIIVYTPAEFVTAVSR